MKLRLRMKWMLFILSAMLLVIPGAVLALVPAAPPEPAYIEDLDVMTVDGDVSDWSIDPTDPNPIIPTDDFFAPMHRAGDPTKKVEANAYLRYDCAQGIMYVLVYTTGEWPVLVERDNSWVAIDSAGNKVVDETTTSFAWVDQGYDGNSDHAKGWEASFLLPQGAFRIFVHTNVLDDGESQTSRTTPKNEGTDLLLDCFTPTAITLASFAAVPAGGGIRLEWETATEIDNVGFNIYRTGDGGSRVKLNASLIASEVPGGVAGGRYEFFDDNVDPGMTYHYWLETVGADGTSVEYGPVSGETTATFRRLKLSRIRLAPSPPTLFDRQ